MKARVQELVGGGMLLLASVIWGFAFAMQDLAMDQMGPVSCNGVRFLIGGVFLFLVVLLRDVSLAKRRALPTRPLRVSKRDLKYGCICGILLFIATTLQQFGILKSGVAAASFITALYMVFVPLLGIALGKLPSACAAAAVVVALLGVYLLSVIGANLPEADKITVSLLAETVKQSGFRLGAGELLLLLCALAFAFHILTVDHCAPQTDGFHLSMIQFLTAGILSLPLMLITERPTLSEIASGILPLLYLGILSCGVAYTLQIFGQARCEPTAAPVIMSLESVFGALGGAIFVSERLNAVEYIGCALLFLAILVSQATLFFPHRRHAPRAEPMP